MTSPLPEFHLHLVGRVVHPPEAFDPASLIGAAYAAELSTDQERQTTEAALADAQAELAELRAFVAKATPSVDMQRYGAARDRADLLERNLAQLGQARDAAARVWEGANAAASAQYGNYSGAVRLWNSIVERGLDWADYQRFSDWAQFVRVLPAQIDAFEQQLRGVAADVTVSE